MQCHFVERTQALDLILKLPQVSSNVVEELLEVSDPDLVWESTVKFRWGLPWWILWSARPYHMSLERLSITFASNGKRKFVPRDQVSSLLVVYCSLFPQKISSFTRFFIHKNCFELFFSCSFSILRNSQLESDVCRLPSTWCLNSLFYSRIRQRKNEANSVFPLATRAVKIGLSSPLGISRVSPTRKRTFSFWMYNWPCLFGRIFALFNFAMLLN